MKSDALVSICIPTYNNAQYIGEMLQSIINQDHENMEIIIGDNASEDDTENLVRGINDARIKYFKHHSRVSATKNWNSCIKLTSSNFVAVYHSDDIYKSDIVEKELNFLLNNVDAGAVACLDEMIDCHGRSLGDGIKLSHGMKAKELFTFDDIFSEFLFRAASFLVSPTFMARKKIFDHVGYFEEKDVFGTSVGGAGDAEMWLRISQKYKVGIIKERLIKRRISHSQSSARWETSRTSESTAFLVLDQYLSQYKSRIKPATLNQYEFNRFWDIAIIAQNLIKQDKKRQAIRKLLSGLTFNSLIACCYSVSNFIKYVIYICLLITSIIGLPIMGISIMKTIKILYAKIR